MMRKIALIVSLGALVSACIAQTARRQAEPTIRQPVRGTQAAIAAGSDYATEAGMQLIEKGGNAVDVGVATMFAAAATELSHFGMGGEAPILIRTRDGKVYSIAGIGTMPKSATADFFRDRPLQPGEVTFRNDGSGLKGVM
jgi:gamma-glutamyltranspeptidase/glutathione hydrolase